jgi:hypothetical protein
VAEIEIGGNEKFTVSIERLEARLGGLVRDYPTELAVRSIYNGLKQWPGIWTKTHGCRRRQELLALGIGGLLAGKHPCDHRMTNASYDGAVKGWRHGATTVSIADSGDGRKATSLARGTEG